MGGLRGDMGRLRGRVRNPNSKRRRALKDVPPTQNPNLHLWGPEKDLADQSFSSQQRERGGEEVWGLWFREWSP